MFLKVTFVGDRRVSWGQPSLPPNRVEYQHSPILWVFLYLCLHPLIQNDQIWHSITYGEGRFYTTATPSHLHKCVAWFVSVSRVSCFTNSVCPSVCSILVHCTLRSVTWYSLFHDAIRQLRAIMFIVICVTVLIMLLEIPSYRNAYDLVCVCTVAAALVWRTAVGFLCGIRCDKLN